MWKRVISSRSLRKTCHQRKLRQTKCLLFNFWVIKLIKTPILPNCQVPNGFFWYSCKFYHSKIKKQTLSLSQFSLVKSTPKGTKDNIFHIFCQEVSQRQITLSIISQCCLIKFEIRQDNMKMMGLSSCLRQHTS